MIPEAVHPGAIPAPACSLGRSELLLVQLWVLGSVLRICITHMGHAAAQLVC